MATHQLIKELCERLNRHRPGFSPHSSECIALYKRSDALYDEVLAEYPGFAKKLDYAMHLKPSMQQLARATYLCVCLARDKGREFSGGRLVRQEYVDMIQAAEAANLIRPEPVGTKH